MTNLNDSELSKPLREFERDAHTAALSGGQVTISAHDLLTLIDLLHQADDDITDAAHCNNCPSYQDEIATLEARLEDIKQAILSA